MRWVITGKIKDGNSVVKARFIVARGLRGRKSDLGEERFFLPFAVKKAYFTGKNIQVECQNFRHRISIFTGQQS